MSRSCVIVASSDLIERPGCEHNRRIGLRQRRRDVALDQRTLPGHCLDGQYSVPPGVPLPRFALRQGHVHRRQHAFARRRVDGIGSHANDLVARPGIGIHAQRLADRLLTGQIPAHERLVDDGHGRTADTIAVVEVPPAQQGYVHRLEPARRGGVAPDAIPAVLWKHRTIAHGHHVVGEPPASGQQPYRRDGCRPHAWVAAAASRRRSTRAPRSSGGMPLASRLMWTTTSGSGAKPSGN